MKLLSVVPITQEEARLFIARHHRHLDRPEGAIALRDVARALGYWKVQTFTLQSESGASLRGAGFVLERPAAEDKARPKGAWGRSRPGRSANLFGEPEISTEPKNRWVCLLGPEPSHVDARQAGTR